MMSVERSRRPITAPPLTNNNNDENNSQAPRTVRTAPSKRSNNSNISNINEQNNVRVVARLRPLSTKEISEQGINNSTTTTTESSASAYAPGSIIAHSSSSTIRIPSHNNNNNDHLEASHNNNNGDSSNNHRTFQFDKVFNTQSTQSDVYNDTCKGMISNSIFKGYNATILAYGQTGSGKTFTMGTDGSTCPPTNDGKLHENEGVIARAVHDLFQAKYSLEQKINGHDSSSSSSSSGDGDGDGDSNNKENEGKVKVTMSYLEIYNEQAIDLLNDDHNNDPSTNNANTTTYLQVRDSKTDGVVIPNLKHFNVHSPTDVRDLMTRASLKRATGSTNMNAVSSRSHAICTLNVTIVGGCADENGEEGDDDDGSPRSSTSSSSTTTATSASSSTHNNGGGGIIKAKLTLVDLAGSERIKKTKAEGARLKEGININKGLFVLGQVVSALSELGQQNGSGSGGGQHIPYRDSKLTRLLQDSLGGNSRTVMIACISPAESNIEESINTLRYAERTRNIKNSAVRNVVSSTTMSASEGAALRSENQKLKLELARMMMHSSSSTNNGMMIHGGGGGNSSGAGRSSSVGFAFGGMFASSTAAATSENMETVTQLKAQCSSLLAEIDLLKDRAKGHADEVLHASLRADKWQTKSEAIIKFAEEQGVDMSSFDNMPSSPNNLGDDGAVGGDLVSQLRHQLVDCKAELLEARTEAVVARATAGAIIAGNGNLNNIEDVISSSDDIGGGDDTLEEDDERHANNNEQLTTELSSLGASIEQKEAMVLQMNKEKACRDHLQLHFESSLKLLMTEVDALTAERDELVVKVSSNDKEDNNSATAATSTNPRRNKRKVNDPMTKRLRGQISKLEERIAELKVKANDHKKSTRMREEAEKKCTRLMSEITEDKRRRAELQKKLKEASVEIRAEKKVAKQNAAKLMKDSQRLKIELSKMKSTAQNQTAVLKRKLDQAAAKEKARREFEKRRQSASTMRLASMDNNSGVNESRKTELTSWIDREFDYSIIKSEIDQQRRKLDKAVVARKNLIKSSGDTVNVEELEQMDGTIRSLRASMQEQQRLVKKAFPASADNNMVSMFRFLETDTYKGLTKPEAKFVVSYIFDTCKSVKQELSSVVSKQEASIKASIDSALTKEQQLHEKEITMIKMEQAEATLHLLMSTQDTVNSNIKLNMSDDNNDGDEKVDELREHVDSVLEAYNESWASTADALKSDLDKIKDTQADHESMLDNIAKGMMVVPKKKPKAKKKAVRNSYDSAAFESEESFVDDDGGEDSEYEPTPAKAKPKRKRQSPRLAKKAAVPSSPASPIGENFLDGIDNKKVGSLKKACKKLGIPVTGRKADLKQSVREHILNSSVAAAMPSHDDDEDENDNDREVSFMVTELPPEFQPIDESTSSDEGVKKKLLWGGEADEKPKSSSSASSSSAAPSKPPKTPSNKSRTPKRKRDDADDDDMGGDSARDSSNSRTPSKRTKLAFGSSSPRPQSFHGERLQGDDKKSVGGSLSPIPRPLSSHNAKSRTPVHLRQTIATSKKRLVPDARQSLAVTKRQSALTASSKKRTKKGMNLAVMNALQCLGEDL